MSAPFKEFDRSQLQILPLVLRKNNLNVLNICPLEKKFPIKKVFKIIGMKLLAARENGASVMMMIGAHVLRSGVQRYLIDLMGQGLITCLAMNGAGMIHDFELALIGATTESVANYIAQGRFGLWQETGRINDIVSEAAKRKMGLGEAVGRIIEEEKFPFREISLLGNAYRKGMLVTVHVGIGYDILHEFPNCDGAAFGATSYVDFLRFAKCLESLEGGVVMNFGSSVMAPEVYLKALAMVRNVARQQGKEISKFATLVCDLKKLPKNYHQEPTPDNPDYYFRPWKTMLVRTVGKGGESYYVQGSHAETIPQLWTAVFLERKKAQILGSKKSINSGKLSYLRKREDLQCSVG